MKKVAVKNNWPSRREVEGFGEAEAYGEINLPPEVAAQVVRGEGWELKAKPKPAPSKKGDNP